MKSVYLIGAGGHARSLINLLELNSYSIKGIYDDDFRANEKICGYDLKGKTADIKSGFSLVIAKGEIDEREKFYNMFNRQLVTANLIHPNAQIEKRVDMGICNQIFSGSYINANASIGNNNLLNSKCTLEHEVIIGDHNHVSVGAILCGRVRVKDRCFIGAAAVIIDKVAICSNVIIGANSTVIKDISEPGVYVGSPAKRIR